MGDVLDLTDERTRTALGVRAEDLVQGDYTTTQAIGAWAERQGYQGILAPSAALPGEGTLIVFRQFMEQDVKLVSVRDFAGTPEPSEQRPSAGP